MSIAIRTQNLNGEQAIYLGPAALVAAKSAPGSWYVVEDGRCTCPGFEHRGHCRHLAVAAEAERLDRETATAVAPAPRPARPWHPQLPQCVRGCGGEVERWGECCPTCQLPAGGRRDL